MAMVLAFAGCEGVGLVERTSTSSLSGLAVSGRSAAAARIPVSSFGECDVGQWWLSWLLRCSGCAALKSDPSLRCALVQDDICSFH